MAAIIAGSAVSFFLFGYASIYWRNATMDLMVIYSALALNDGAALDGGDISLAGSTGQPLVIVNTASLCGYTPQYAGLQDLWTEFHGRGLMIVGVPSNDFGGQEPGGSAEIAETAQYQYGVTFSIAAKAAASGRAAH